MNASNIKNLFFLLSLLLTLSACKPGLIPNTSVVDNDENMAITNFLVKYRQAMEDKSAEDVMALVAKDYNQAALESPNNTNTALNYNYDTLEKNLEKFFSHAKKLSLSFHIQHVYNEVNLYEVVYFYNQQVLYNFKSGEEWVSTKDVNRMILRKIKDENSEDTFEILRGL